MWLIKVKDVYENKEYYGVTSDVFITNHIINIFLSDNFPSLDNIKNIHHNKARNMYIVESDDKLLIISLISVKNYKG